MDEYAEEFDYLGWARELVGSLRGTDTSQMDLRDLRDEMEEALEEGGDRRDEGVQAFLDGTLKVLKQKLALN